MGTFCARYALSSVRTAVGGCAAGGGVVARSRASFRRSTSREGLRYCGIESSKDAFYKPSPRPPCLPGAASGLTCTAQHRRSRKQAKHLLPQ